MAFGPRCKLGHAPTGGCRPRNAEDMGWQSEPVFVEGGGSGIVRAVGDDAAMTSLRA